jgi:potassium efflux system protein
MIVTVSAAKTLPSLLEISVLHRLPLDNGARNAIVIISRYAVTILGFVLACNMLGIRWASVQWLAAAMTVGLGFGLQEIFANLVSGLIILFERPIRIGDLVTVGGTTGRISRMQIRATTITDFDRREMIVPNKKFITDDVVNWTLSDQITRFVLPVGISYDCDPDQAQKLLLDLAKKHPLVLRDPEPSAVFIGFGDSTLNLELRVFLGRRDDFVKLQHELNLAVGREFKAAGIEIAFPQQDIHIRSIKGALDLTAPKSQAQQKVAEGNEGESKAA